MCLIRYFGIISSGSIIKVIIKVKIIFLIHKLYHLQNYDFSDEFDEWLTLKCSEVVRTSSDCHAQSINLLGRLGTTTRRLRINIKKYFKVCTRTLQIFAQIGVRKLYVPYKIFRNNFIRKYHKSHH